jgi:hypothetical protein
MDNTKSDILVIGGRSFSKEGIALSIGAIVLGTYISTMAELVISGGRFKETTLYQVSAVLPSKLLNKKDN